MRFYIEGKEVELINKEVKVAKMLVNKFLELVQKRTDTNGRSLYYTLLIVMHVMSQDLIKSIETDNIIAMLNTYAKKINAMDEAANNKLSPRGVISPAEQQALKEIVGTIREDTSVSKVKKLEPQNMKAIAEAAKNQTLHIVTTTDDGVDSEFMETV